MRRSRERASRPLRNEPRRRGAHFTVLAPAALAAEITRQVGRGSLARAAAAVGMSRQTLHRLAAGRAARITVRTLEQLEQLLPESGLKWAKYILSPDGHQAFVAYVLWLRSSFDQLRRDRGAGSAIEVVHEEAEWRGRSAEWADLVERARRATPDVFTALDALMNDRNFVGDRIQVGLGRILEPLLESYASGGIERYHGTLSDDELADFVRAGFLRETILLNRDNDLARAQHAIKRSPSSRSVDDQNGIVDSLQNLLPSHSPKSGEASGALSHLLKLLT